MSNNSKKRPLVSTAAKIAILIVVTIGATLGITLEWFLKVRNAEIAVKNLHFGDEELDNQLDEILHPDIEKHRERIRNQEHSESTKVIEVEENDIELNRLVSADEVVVIGSSLPELHYDWQEGCYYRYSYSVDASPPYSEVSYEGECSLLCGPDWNELTDYKRFIKTAKRDRDTKSKDSKSNRKKQDDLEESTGTAFVISEDGYLMTCAHVVEGAKLIEITLNGKLYEAKLKTINHKNDLAIIKIEAEDLLPLAYGDSSNLRLGEDVRAIGYPLSDFLNSSLTVTSGTVSGLQKTNKGSLIQIDASVNPGNSGGPVVNNQGAFIGIASSKLFGAAISNVAFSVPSKDALKLMKMRGINEGENKLPRNSSGPDLIEHVARSVAHVRVWSFDIKEKPLPFKATIKQDVEAVPSSGIGWNKTPVNEKTDLLISRLGHLSKHEAKTIAPFLWRHPLELIIQPLDEDGEEEWFNRQQMIIKIPEVRRISRANHIFGIRNPRRLPGGFAMPAISAFGEEPTSYKADLISLSKTMKREDDLLTIYTESGLEAEQLNGTPGFEITGNIVLQYDLKRKIPRNGVARFECEWTQDPQKESFPISYQFSLISPKEHHRRGFRKAYHNAFLKEARAEHEAYKNANDPNYHSLEANLMNLKECLSNNLPAIEFLEALKGFEVSAEQKPEFIELLKQIIARSFKQEKLLAYQAMRGVVDKNDTLYLIKLLENLEFPDGVMDAIELIELLKETKDPKAAPVLAQIVLEGDMGTEMTALRALESLGKAAEDPLLEILPKLDEIDVNSVINVLGSIGGEKSEKALTNYILESDHLSRSFASHSLEEIRSRLKNGDPIRIARYKANINQPNSSRVSNSPYAIANRELSKIEKFELEEQEINELSFVKQALEALTKLPVIEELRPRVQSSLLRFLDNQYPAHLTLAAIKALGVWGDEVHSEKLFNMLERAKTPEARYALFKALGQIGNEKTSARLVTLIEDPTYGFAAMQAFRKLSKSDEEKVISLLSTSDVYTRARAAYVLGMAGSETAKEALTESMEAEPDSLALREILKALARFDLRESAKSL